MIAAKTSRDRPNIIFIMSDDHAQAAISAHGEPIGQMAPTPNIDRIAKNGALFENSYVTNSLCGPSRTRMLTGQFRPFARLLQERSEVRQRRVELAARARRGGLPDRAVRQLAPKLFTRRRRHPNLEGARRPGQILQPRRDHPDRALGGRGPCDRHRHIKPVEILRPHQRPAGNAQPDRRSRSGGHDRGDERQARSTAPAVSRQRRTRRHRRAGLTRRGRAGQTPPPSRGRDAPPLKLNWRYWRSGWDCPSLRCGRLRRWRTCDSEPWVGPPRPVRQTKQAPEGLRCLAERVGFEPTMGF